MEEKIIITFFSVTKNLFDNFDLFTPNFADLHIKNIQIFLNHFILSTCLYDYLLFYVDSYYSNILTYCFSINYTNNKHITFILSSKLINIFYNSIFLFIFISVILYTKNSNFVKQTVYSVKLIKLFHLNENEKELGSTDDFIFFIFLFISVIMMFIISITSIFLFELNILYWIILNLIFLSILIITIPLNLFIDYSLNFFSYIRGSSTSNNIIKELIFDLIAVGTIIVRFIIQNIRFVFIFVSIFELFEWTLNITSAISINSTILEKNFFILTTEVYVYSNWNLLLLNTILSSFYYLYYFLHLLFLLFMQTSIYALISIWLFFFLYTTFILNKTEKIFFYKKFIL